jgi:hypothetical protein
MMPTASASAGRVKLPPELLGTWCVEYSDDKSTLYDRGNCANKADGSWIVMGPDGYKAFEVDCRTIASTAVRRKYVARPVYVLQMHCTGLDKENWQQRLSIFLGKGDMLVVEGRR